MHYYILQEPFSSNRVYQIKILQKYIISSLISKYKSENRCVFKMDKITQNEVFYYFKNVLKLFTRGFFKMIRIVS